MKNQLNNFKNTLKIVLCFSILALSVSCEEAFEFELPEAGSLPDNTLPTANFDYIPNASLTIGGIIAVIAIAIRKELLLPILAGIFVVENMSVIIQVFWFKFTKKKFGEGRRVFRMAPLHHHYQKLSYHESKIVVRFWIIGILLAVLTIVTLKLR